VDISYFIYFHLGWRLLLSSITKLAVIVPFRLYTILLANHPLLFKFNAIFDPTQIIYYSQFIIATIKTVKIL